MGDYSCGLLWVRAPEWDCWIIVLLNVLFEAFLYSFQSGCANLKYDDGSFTSASSPMCVVGSQSYRYELVSHFCDVEWFWALLQMSGNHPCFYREKPVPARVPLIALFVFFPLTDSLCVWCVSHSPGVWPARWSLPSESLPFCNPSLHLILLLAGPLWLDVVSYPLCSGFLCFGACVW